MKVDRVSPGVWGGQDAARVPKSPDRSSRVARCFDLSSRPLPIRCPAPWPRARQDFLHGQATDWLSPAHRPLVESALAGVLDQGQSAAVFDKVAW